MGKNILLVDDNEIAVDTQREIIKRASLPLDRLDVDYDGQEALERIMSFYKNEAKTYDLLISDYEMPMMDGYQLYLNLRDKKYAPKNIVFITGELENFKKKMNGYYDDSSSFEKPILMSKLLDIIEKKLNS